jgi:hypothetical protein
MQWLWTLWWTQIKIGVTGMPHVYWCTICIILHCEGRYGDGRPYQLRLLNTLHGKASSDSLEILRSDLVKVLRRYHVTVSASHGFVMVF